MHVLSDLGVQLVMDGRMDGRGVVTIDDAKGGIDDVAVGWR